MSLLLAAVPILVLLMVALTTRLSAMRWTIAVAILLSISLYVISYGWITRVPGWWHVVPSWLLSAARLLLSHHLISNSPSELALLPGVILLAVVSALTLLAEVILDMFPQTRVVRGADVDNVANSAALALSRITFGGAAVPANAETRGFLLLGSPGTGKTQQIHSMLLAARKRNDRAIIVDAGGDLLSRHYREGDIILSIEDARSTKWSPWSDLVPGAEFDLARSIIPDGFGSAAEWNGYAQGLIAAIIERLAEREGVTTGDLLHAVELATLDELDELVSGTGAARLTAEGNERMASSVLAIVGTAFRRWSRLAPEAGAKAFSIRNWVRADTRDGQWLWLPYSADAEASTRPLRRTWVDLAIRAALSLRPDSERRLWLTLDELAACGQLPSLETAARQGRKYGLVPVAGFQVQSQVEEAYGDKGAQSILSCLGNRLTLRVDDPRTAQYAAQSVGKMEQAREQVTRSSNTGKDGGSSGTSKVVVHEIRDAVLDSEIMTLPDMRGFVKVAGQQWRRARIKFIDLPEVAPAIVPVQRRRAASAQSQPMAPAAAAVDLPPPPTPVPEPELVSDATAEATATDIDDLLPPPPTQED